ncbi:hypothetical protein GOM71_12930 [Paenibacillus sp. NEAU-GSW1]|nr:hypothetical protein [Paenibacillus sp. NEAU-GSW1]
MWVILYAAASGVLLGLFSILTAVVKFIFSLLALFLVLRFFKRYERWGARGAFIATALVFFFIFLVCYSAYFYMTTNDPSVASPSV